MMNQEDLNDKIIEAYKNDEYQAIMNKASSKYKFILNSDEIESCHGAALWKAISKYDENFEGKKMKFSSYLYQGVVFQCRTLAKFNGNSRRGGSLNEELAEDPDSIIEYMEIIESLESIENGDILIDAYVNGYSTKEIAKKKGVTSATIRLKKKKAIEKVKARLY